MTAPIRPTPRQLLGELEYALPSELVECYVLAFEEAVRTGDEAGMEPARRRLQNYSEDCAASAEGALHVLDPSVAFDQSLLRSVIRRLGPGHALEGIGLNRFVWMAGIAGGGTNGSVEAFTDYLRMAAGWYAGQVCANLLPQANPDNIPLGVLLNSLLEDTRRVAPTTIQFRWVSHTIIKAAADEIAADQRRYAALADFTPDVVDETFAYILRSANVLSTGSRRSWQRRPLQVTSLTPGCKRLLTSLASPPGALAGQSFKRLVSERLIETQPLVSHAGAVVPLGYREALLGLEQAFFEMTRRLLPDKDRSDLFERTTSRCLAQWGPADLTEQKPPLAVRINRRDPGEVDFALQSPNHLVLGECKAYLVTTGSDAVINTFPDQMGKAAKQLGIRAAALQAGSPLTSAGSPSSLGGRDILQIAVPLHSYAGAAWHADCLAQIPNALGARFAIIPLHQLVILAAAMRNTAELAEYLAHRHLLLSSRLICHDETDYLVGFLNPARHRVVRRILALAKDERAQLHLNPCSVSPGSSIHSTPPRSPEDWRSQLYKMADCPAPI